MRINDLPILLRCRTTRATTVASHRKLGEDGVYATYAGSDLAYTIIRPGQLNGGPYDNNYYLGAPCQP